MVGSLVLARAPTEKNHLPHPLELPTKLTILGAGSRGKTVEHFRGKVDITVDRVGSHTLLSIRGTCDHFNAEDCLGRILRALPGDLQHLLVDVSEVKSFSSAAMGIFFQMMPELRRRGGDLRFFGVKGKAKLIFETLSMDECVFWRFSDLKEALAPIENPLPESWRDHAIPDYLSRKGEAVFHIRGCPLGHAIPEEDLEVFEDLNEAKLSGKEPCPHCLPSLETQKSSTVENRITPEQAKGIVADLQRQIEAGFDSIELRWPGSS